MNNERFEQRVEEAKKIIHDKMDSLKAAKRVYGKTSELSESEQDKIARRYQNGVRNLLEGKVDFTGVPETDVDKELNELVLAVIKAELFGSEDEKDEPTASTSARTGTDTDADKIGTPPDASSGQATGSGEKGEAPEDELTDSEIASLPDLIKNEVNKFVSLKKSLEDISQTPATNKSVLEAQLEMLKDQLQLLQLKDLNKVVVSSSLPIDQKEKIINFAKKILNRANNVLNPPTTTAPAISSNKKDYPPLKFEGTTDEVTFASKLDEAFRLRYEQDPEEAVRFLITSANQAVSNYFASGGGLGSGSFKQLLGTFWILSEFNQELKRHKRVDGKFHSQYKLEDIPDPSRRDKLITDLRRKASELICVGYIEHTTRKFGDIVSMTSDWEKMIEFAGQEQDHFTTKTYDALLQPEMENKNEGVYCYQYADLLRWAMWKTPGWISVFGRRYDDKVAESRVNFDKEVKNKFIVPKLEAAYKANTGFTEKVGDKELTVSAQTVKALYESMKSTDNPDFDNFLKYFQSISTSLGVRLHTFRNNLARGETPARGLQTHRRWMAAVCPYALNNYNCYKGLSPHLSIEGFSVELGEPIQNKDDVISLDEKIFNINLSLAKTKELLLSVEGKLRPVIELGDLSKEFLDDKKTIPNPAYGIDNIYPDLYSFVVKNYDERRVVEKSEGKKEGEEKVAGTEISKSGGAAADLITWFAGLKAAESFVEQAIAPPLGTFDRKSIAEMNPETAREKMLDVLVGQLVQRIVSPLKANQAWVRWDHIAQFLLMYTDKMFRTYRLIDDSEGGTATLAREIREKIYLEMGNLGGVGDENTPYLSEFIEPNEGVATPTNSTPSIKDKLIGTPAEMVGLSPETIKKLSSGGIKLKKGYDLRDYVMNRIVRATGSTFNRLLIRLNYAVIDDGGSIARARATTGSKIDSLIVRPVASFKIEKSKFFDRNKVQKFYKGCESVLFGTPTEEQKKTVDEKK